MSETPSEKARRIAFQHVEHLTCQAWGNAAHLEGDVERRLATLLAMTHELVCSRMIDRGSSHCATDALHSLDRLERATAAMRAKLEAVRDARLDVERSSGSPPRTAVSQSEGV